LWSRRFPRSHALGRKIYNRCGPVIARRISSPWLADLVFLVLKPGELFAAIVLRRLARAAQDKS